MSNFTQYVEMAKVSFRERWDSVWNGIKQKFDRDDPYMWSQDMIRALEQIQKDEGFGVYDPALLHEPYKNVGVKASNYLDLLYRIAFSMESYNSDEQLTSKDVFFLKFMFKNWNIIRNAILGNRSVLYEMLSEIVHSNSSMREKKTASIEIERKAHAYASMLRTFIKVQNTFKDKFQVKK